MGEIINWSLTASSIILVVFLIEFLFGKKLSKTYQCALWGIVLIRLLVPYMPSSSLSVFNLVTHFKETQQESQISNQAVVHHQMLEIKDIQEDEDILPGVSEETALAQMNKQKVSTPVAEKKASIGGSQVTYYIWLLGMCLTGTYFLYGYIRVGQKIKKLESVEDKAILQLFEDCKKQVSPKKEIEYIRLVNWDTSMIYGIRKPTIAVPRQCEAEGLKIILLHELTHYRYKDHWMNMVQLIVLSLHWFNPLVWLAIRKMKEDMECACDERVIHLGVSKKSYAETLLNMIRPTSYEMAFMQGMGDGPKQVKNRIQNIVGLKKRKLVVSILSMSLVTLLAVGCLTDANSGANALTDVANSGDGTALEIKHSSKWTGIQNIAVFGMDPDGRRTDSIMVVQINCESGQTNVISIPRDIMVVLDESKNKTVKLAEMLAYVGEEQIDTQVVGELEKLLDLEIQHYVLVDIDEAKEVVDALGGIEIYVPQDMMYNDYEQNLEINLKEGMQHLNGDQTMQLIRYRIYPKGDLQRVQTTQLAVKSILEKALSLSSVKDFKAVIEGVQDTIETNISLLDIGQYYKILKKIDLEQITFYVLPGQGENIYGRSFFIVDEEANSEMKELLF